MRMHGKRYILQSPTNLLYCRVSNGRTSATKSILFVMRTNKFFKLIFTLTYHSHLHMYNTKKWTHAHYNFIFMNVFLFSLFFQLVFSLFFFVVLLICFMVLSAILAKKKKKVNKYYSRFLTWFRLTFTCTNICFFFTLLHFFNLHTFDEF